MPKPKPPADPNQAAKSILDRLTGDKPKMEPAAKDTAAVEHGWRGGLKGGAARAAALPPEERKRIAQEATRKRWAPPKGDGVE